MIATCSDCGKTFIIPVTDEQVSRMDAGELIQNVMPEVPEDLRELLISGICGNCFDALFEDDDDEDDEVSA